MKKIIKLAFFMISFVAVPAILILMTSFYIRSYYNKSTYYYKKIISSCNHKERFFNVSNMRYAKVKDNCYLFKTADVSDASYRNVEFIIPSSYFVVVLSDVNAYTKRVQYNNKIGYVSSDSVEEVDFTPVTPYLIGITFDVEENVGTQLRKSPIASDNSNIITLIPAGTKNISYVASIQGVMPTSGNSPVWFYVIYTPVSDPTSVYEGYVYSGKTLNLSEIPINTEGVKIDIDDVEDSKSFVLNDKVKTILILIISAPIVLVFILLVINTKKSKVKQIDEVQEIREKECKERRSVIENNLNKIDDFDGVVLKKKKPFYSKFIEEDSDKFNQNSVNFPSYDMDDDLL